MVAQTRHGGPSKKRLTFHEKLLPKGINTDALLKKLKTLHTQLASLDQDTVDTSSLNTARAELIHHSLLLHKDRGVKAYTACCLADILRLYAPEAPYTQAELRDIFQFFFRQLSAGLKGQDETYYNEYYHLLESLSTVKSVVLVCDFPSADEILQEIFRDLFTVVKRDLTKKVELFMADILVALIDESNSLPGEALDILMAQFKDKNAKNDNPSYRLAAQVCNGAADKLQRHVCQYFGDLLTSTPAEEEQDEDIDTVRAAHDLIKQLQRACPTVLHSVIPILEAELRSESLNPRIIATQTLGEMYGDKGGQDLVRKYPTTWAAWLNRRADVAVPVRLKCLEAIPPLFLALPEQASALDELIRAKFFDPDERVRAATCKLFSQLDYETALHHIAKEHLETLVGRGMDKKASVRKEALNSAGKIYSLAYPEIANNDHSAAQQFAWIPHEILGMASTSFELRALVDGVLADYLLPLPSEKDVDEGAWTDRLLTVMRHLIPKSTTILVALSNVKSNRPTIFEIFVDACVQNNGGIVDGDREAIERKLKLVIQHISSTFPDKVKAVDDLNSFAKLNESRLYKLLKTVMDPQTDLKGLVRATNDFLKRTEQLSSSLIPTMTIFIRRCSYGIVNQSAVPFLLEYLSEARAPANAESNKKRRSTMSSTRTQYAAINSLTLLVTIAKNNPTMLRPHLGELTKILADGGADDRRESFGSINVGSSMEVALMALANLAKTKEGTGLAGAPERRINQRIMKLALDSDWRQAKFATRYLTLSTNKDEVCTQLVGKICAEINDQKRSEPISLSCIASLVQLVRFAPQAFEAESETIMTHLVKRVIMAPIPAQGGNEEEWIENDDLPDELRAKIQALKVCRHRTLSHASAEDALKMAAPVLKLLATTMDHDGSLNPDVEEDPRSKTRMRLQAAISLLHLATVPVFATAIQPKFVRLACTIQDSCFEVRQTFLTKLIVLLQTRKLPTSYNIIPFLTMLDPEQDIRLLATSYVDGQKKRITPAIFLEQFELIFIRLLHLLAHHPDFATTQEELIDMAGYINFYLDQVATQDNVSLLYHLAQKGKSVRDPESHSRSEKFYIMCEIAQLLIRTRAQNNSWLLPAYPGKVKLPSDILTALPNPEAVNRILKTVYLTDEATGWLMEKYAGPKEKEKKEKEKKERKERVPSKRKTAPTKSNGHAKRPRKKRSGSDDSEADEPPATSEAGSDVEMEDGTTQAKQSKQSREERLNARLKAKEKTSKEEDDEQEEEEEEAEAEE